MINRFYFYGIVVLLLSSSLSFGAPGKAVFPHRVVMVSLPEFLTEGRMFKDPEIAVGNWFGGGLAIGDWNRDGQNDILISSFLADPNGVSNAGAVFAFLGPDFVNSERVTALPEPEAGDNFGMQIAFEDMNGDGVADLVATGLRSRYISDDGSVNLDQAGSFRVVWGPDYTEGVRFFDEYPEASATLGRGLAVADFNEDGKKDIAIGGIGAYRSMGKVIFRFGPDYLEQQELLSPIIEDGMRFGANLAAGDWNGDGHVDLIVGSDKATSESGLLKAGHVQVWFGPGFKEDGVLVFEEKPQAIEDNNFGAAVDFGDLTGDGIPDLVVGISDTKWDGKAWVGQVKIFPGPSYEQIIELESPQRGENCIFGSEVEIGDVNGDGVNDLVVGEYYATVDGKSMAGRAWLFLGIKTVIGQWELY